MKKQKNEQNPSLKCGKKPTKSEHPYQPIHGSKKRKTNKQNRNSYLNTQIIRRYAELHRVIYIITDKLNQMG